MECCSFITYFYLKKSHCFIKKSYFCSGIVGVIP